MDYDKINVKRELKIIFMGTPEFAVNILDGILENHKIRAVVTQPDRISPSGKTLTPPVKRAALEKNILVLQPLKIRNFVEEIIALEPDLIITCAYGQMLPIEILECPEIACINVHASILPKLRGGAPIHTAIINGYKKTGITIMHMDKEMDQGDIISTEEIAIEEDETASTLHDKLSILGKSLLVKTLPSIIDGTAPRIKQNHSEATYAPTIKREDEKIDFSKSKREIYNQIRGLNSWPGAFCYLNSKILKVWESTHSDRIFPTALEGEITGLYKEGIGVKVSNGEIILTLIQPEGKPKMSASSYINGLQNKEELIGRILS